MYLTKDMYPEYIKNSQTQLYENKPHNLKMDKNSFYQRGYRNDK